MLIHSCCRFPQVCFPPRILSSLFSSYRCGVWDSSLYSTLNLVPLLFFVIVVVSVVAVNLFGLLAKLVGSRWYVHTISYCCRNKNSESGIYDLVIDIREHELYLCQW